MCSSLRLEQILPGIHMRKSATNWSLKVLRSSRLENWDGPNAKTWLERTVSTNVDYKLPLCGSYVVA